MRVLLTGAAGFLGSHLVDRLLAEGHHVVGMDNFLTGQRANLAHLTHEPRFDLVEHDVAQPWPDLGPVDAVLHFASPASPNAASPYGYPNLPIETMLTNSQGTYYGLEYARRYAARFLLASTSEVYGDPQVHPQPETYWGYVNPIGPRAVYDEAKRYAEAMTMAYHRHYGLDVRIVRIFNTYGPRMRLDDGRVIPNFIVQALQNQPLTIYGDGSQTRSFCYVDDLIEGIVRLLKVEAAPFPVNLGNPDEYTILALAQTINRLLQNPGGLRFEPERYIEGDPKRRRPDIQRAKTLLGWWPKISLDEGLRRTIEDFRRRLGVEKKA